jgi:hypothetical protein
MSELEKVSFEIRNYGDCLIIRGNDPHDTETTIAVRGASGDFRYLRLTMNTRAGNINFPGEMRVQEGFERDDAEVKLTVHEIREDGIKIQVDVASGLIIETSTGVKLL